MARRRNLRNAPILEALLDIRVAPPADASVKALAAMDQKLAPEYKRQGEKRTSGIELKLDAKAEQFASVSQASSAHVGYSYVSPDKRRVVQVTTDNFTQNFVGGYTEFAALSSEARTNWERYLEVYRPATVTRLALRYINDLRIPKNMTQFEDYLTAGPVVPPGLPETLSNFFIRMTMHHPAIGAQAIINQIFQGQVDQEGVHVILDIDAIIDCQMPSDDAGLWGKFDQLREFKNEIFFGFVTERLIERFE